MFHISWSKTSPYSGRVLLQVETPFPIGTVPWPRAGIARTTWRCRLQRTQSAAKLGEKLPAGISFGPSPPPKERGWLSPPKTLLLHLAVLASRDACCQNPSIGVDVGESPAAIHADASTVPVPAPSPGRSVGRLLVRPFGNQEGWSPPRSLGPA